MVHMKTKKRKLGLERWLSGYVLLCKNGDLSLDPSTHI